MALQREQARGLGLLEELRVQRFVPQAERDVHARAAHPVDRVRVETRAVDVVVEHLRLGGVDLAEVLDAALLRHPLEHQAREVPAERVRRVQHRAFLRLRRIVQDRRQRRRAAREQVVAHDHHHQAGGADVLLRAGVDDPVLRDVDRAREDVRRHVGHDRHAGRVGQVVHLDAADRLVRRDVDVGSLRVPRIPVGQAQELRRFARAGDAHRAGRLRFLRGLLAPGARDDVVGTAAGGEVHRDLREMQRRAALQEQDLVVVGDGHQRAQVALGFLGERDEVLAAMADLHHGSACAAPLEHLVARLREHGFRQCRRTRAEVVAAGHLTLRWFSARSATGDHRFASTTHGMSRS